MRQKWMRVLMSLMTVVCVCFSSPPTLIQWEDYRVSMGTCTAAALVWLL